MANISKLRQFREKQGLSQRILAQKSGISRSRLRRLEGKHFEQTTYSELIRLSRALGVQLKELLRREEDSVSGATMTRAGETPFQLGGGAVGYRIVSFLPPVSDMFAGKLFVSPHKRLSSIPTPHAKIIFLQILLGSLLLQISGMTHRMREGDNILFEGDSPCLIENPLSRDSVALLFTVPSLLP